MTLCAGNVDGGVAREVCSVLLIAGGSTITRSLKKDPKRVKLRDLSGKSPWLPLRDATGNGSLIDLDHMYNDHGWLCYFPSSSSQKAC